jgi:hypothetical protein
MDASMCFKKKELITIKLERLFVPRNDNMKIKFLEL